MLTTFIRLAHKMFLVEMFKRWHIEIEKQSTVHMLRTLDAMRELSIFEFYHTFLNCRQHSADLCIYKFFSSYCGY